MCSLRFENNFLTVGHVRFRFENSCLAIERVRFATKIIFVLSNVFSSFRENYLLTIEGVRFASISKKTSLSKLSLRFVSLRLASTLVLPLMFLNVFTLQRPVQFLEVSTLQRPELHLDVSALQTRAYLLQKVFASLRK